MKKMTIALIALIVIGVGFLSGCADVEIPEDLIQFQISSFKVEPSIITSGETANLSWVIIGGSSANIDNGIGAVSLSGSRIIMPTHTTTYTITALNATTSLQATVHIIVTNESDGGNGPAESFPNIVMKDATDTCTSGVGDDLFIIEHRAGETIDWSYYRVYVKTSDETDVTEYLYFDGSLGGPVGSFSVVDQVIVSESITNIVGPSGETLKLTIVDDTQPAIVYENTVFVE